MLEVEVALRPGHRHGVGRPQPWALGESRVSEDARPVRESRALRLGLRKFLLRSLVELGVLENTAVSTRTRTPGASPAKKPSVVHDREEDDRVEFLVVIVGEQLVSLRTRDLDVTSVSSPDHFPVAHRCGGQLRNTSSLMQGARNDSMNILLPYYWERKPYRCTGM